MNNETSVTATAEHIVKGKKPLSARLWEQRYLLMMSVPIIIWLIVFAYVPLAGWAIAFFNFRPGISLLDSDFVGIRNFRLMFMDQAFFQAIRNTLIFSVLGLVTGFTSAIGFALLLNELRSMKIKRVVQTVSYLPHFVSWVVVAGMVLQVLTLDGVINQFLMFIRVLDEPVNWMSQPQYFYAIVTLANLWKGLGWSTIIYLSAMAGVDQELYEAAAADGAGRLRRIWHVTLPGIAPTIIILLVMSFGGLLHTGFEDKMLLRNPFNAHLAEVLSLYTLRLGIQAGRFGFGTAVSMFTSMISLTLVLIANATSRKFTDSGLF